MVCLQVVDGLDEALHALQTMGFVEGQVGLVGHAIRGRGIYDGLVELKNRVMEVEDALRHLLRVAVETHAEERALLLNLLYQFLSCHRLDL